MSITSALNNMNDIPSKDLRERHHCGQTKECQKTGNHSSCWDNFYKNVQEREVWDEDWIKGQIGDWKPAIDVAYSKLMQQGEDSWGAELQKSFEFVQNSRNANYASYQRIREGKKAFSVTVDKSSIREMRGFVDGVKAAIEDSKKKAVERGLCWRVHLWSG